MKPPTELIEIRGRLRYSVADSTLLAGDDYWDGNNWERAGRNTFLYRTKGGRYFSVTLTCWQGERTTLTPVEQDEAIELFENMTEKRVSFEAAFPGVTVEDA